ncbi:MAG TPA: hypothetical protein VG184_00900 [Acidimicrobiales bacterium]|jgi:capsular polysaccharide biosynthesis protein|nr:hypothetical protein [Acidimicrobiales bacterium]
MELRRYLAIVARRWLLIIVTVVLALGVAYLVTPRTSLYTAQSTIVVGPRQYSTTSFPANLSGNQVAGLQVLMLTYADLIASAPIAADAIALTHAPRAVGTVVAETKASPALDTQILTVTVTDPNPAVAQELATGVADAFVAKVNPLSPTAPAAAGAVPEIPAYVFEPAGLPTSPQSTGLGSRLVTAAIFGLLAAVLLAILLEYLDVTLNSPDDAERRLELPVLGVLPYLPGTGPPDTPPVVALPSAEENTALEDDPGG